MPDHTAVFLRGYALPGARRVVRHDYPITPSIFDALRNAQPDVVIVSGWSTFASQAAGLLVPAALVPFVLLVESHDAGPKAGWRRTVKTTAVPPILARRLFRARGRLAGRESVLALGADPARVRVFANTIDVAGWAARADELAGRRAELRKAFGLAEEIAVLSVARLAPEKSLDVLLRAATAAGVRPLIVGSGPDRAYLETVARDAIFTGELPGDRVAEAYVGGGHLCAAVLSTSRGVSS